MATQLTRLNALPAAGWGSVDILARQGLQFAVTVVLARILTPADYGQIAMLLFFTGLASVIADCGLSTALVQRRDATHEEESAVFWTTLAVGSLMTLLLASSALTIATLLSAPTLAPMLQVASINVLIVSFGSIQSTLLNKRLKFKKQMVIGMIAAASSGSVAIYMAKAGHAAWSLVAQMLLMSTVTSVLLWWSSAWRPLPSLNLQALKALMRFSVHLLLAAVLDIAYTRLHSVILGQRYGAHDLGIYSNADSTKQLPVGFMYALVSKITLPLFSHSAADPVVLKQDIRSAISLSMLVNAPMMIGVAAVAAPLVETLFGQKWLPAAPLLQILCLGGVLWPLHVINLNALLASGRSNLYLRVEIIKKAGGLCLLIAGAYLGLSYLAWATVISSVFSLFVNAHYTGKHLDYGVSAQIRDILGTLFVSAAMGGIVYLVDMQWDAPAYCKLIGLVITGVTAFVVIAFTTRLADFRLALTFLGQRSRSGSAQ